MRNMLIHVAACLQLIIIRTCVDTKTSRQQPKLNALGNIAASYHMYMYMYTYIYMYMCMLRWLEHKTNAEAETSSKHHARTACTHTISYAYAPVLATAGIFIVVTPQPVTSLALASSPLDLGVSGTLLAVTLLASSSPLVVSVAATSLPLHPDDRRRMRTI